MEQKNFEATVEDVATKMADNLMEEEANERKFGSLADFVISYAKNNPFGTRQKPRSVLQIPSEYIFEYGGIQRAIKDGYDPDKIYINKARGNNVILQFVGEESTLELFNAKDVLKSTGLTDRQVFTVVAVGENVKDINVGDIVACKNTYTSTGDNDVYCREYLRSAIRDMDTNTFGEFTKFNKSIRFHTFFVINQMDIYMVKK